MTHRIRSLAIVLVLLGLARSMAAQQPSLPAAVDSGRMVRMYTATTMIEGRLLARFDRNDPSLRYCRFPGRPCLGIEDTAAMRTMPVTELRRLEIATGSHWRRGATIGGVVGGVLGALSTAFAISFCESAHCADNRASIIVLGGMSGGLTFGALGALWGSAFPRWEAPH